MTQNQFVADQWPGVQHRELHRPPLGGDQPSRCHSLGDLVTADAIVAARSLMLVAHGIAHRRYPLESLQPANRHQPTGKSIELRSGDELTLGNELPNRA